MLQAARTTSWGSELSEHTAPAPQLPMVPRGPLPAGPNSSKEAKVGKPWHLPCAAAAHIENSFFSASGFCSQVQQHAKCCEVLKPAESFLVQLPRCSRAASVNDADAFFAVLLRYL